MFINKCIICHDNCYLPLKCSCRYDVHYDCIYKWYFLKNV